MSRFIATLFVIEFGDAFSYQLVNAVYAVYVKKLGGNLATAGTSIALNLLIVGVLIVVSGRIANKYHTEKIQLLLSALIAVLVAIGYLWIDNSFQLYFIVALSGVGIALSTPAISGLLSSRLKEGKHTEGWGDYLGLGFLAAGLGALTSGLISEHFGFNALFVTLLIVQILSGLAAVSLFFMKEKG